MTSWFKKKNIFLPLLGLVLLLLPLSANAQLSFLGNIAFSVVGKAFFALSWVISAIAGIAITLEAWILGWVLQINSNIIESAPVRVGFPVALSLANLLLVFGIIVIAIMTILRSQTYGVKQALWRLIVIAIAINFGLVIAGVILYFFDSLSFYFLSVVDPAGGSGGTSGFSSYATFATAIAGAFNPQKFALVQQNPGVDPQSIQSIRDAFGQTGSGIGALIIPITGLIFTVFALIFIVIVLGALIVMLIIRYVYIGYLLILLPVAWVGWVFPGIRSWWERWWRNFFHQAAFAPVVLFFMWVFIQTSYFMSQADYYKLTQSYQSPSNPAWGAISQFFTGIFEPTLQQFLQMSVLLGVMLGGLFAAKSISIRFADAAVTAAEGSAKTFGGWASRKGVQAGTRAFRGAGGQKAAASLQRGKIQQRLRGMPVIGGALGLGASYLGGGIEKIGTIGADQAIKQAEKNLEPMTDQQVAHGMSRFDAPTMWAALQRLKKNNNLDLVAGDLGKYLDRNRKAEAERFNQGEFFDTTRGEVGLTVLEKILELKGQGKSREDVVRGVAGEIKGAKNAQYLAKNFILDEEKFNKLNPLGIQNFRDYQEYQSYVMAGMALGASGSALASFYTELAKGKSLDIAADAMRRSGTTKTQIERENPGADTWYQNTAARNLGVDYKSNGVVGGIIIT